MDGIDSLGAATGIVLIVLGVVLLVVSVFFWPAVFYAVGCLVLGVAILLTLKSQESIEQIKNKRNK